MKQVTFAELHLTTSPVLTEMFREGSSDFSKTRKFLFVQ